MHTNITDLRKKGQLDEAYSIAIQEYNKDKDNFKIKGELSWVLYDKIKNKLEISNFIGLESDIELLNNLHIDRRGEIDIYEKTASLFYKSIKDEGRIDKYKKKLFFYLKLANNKPSKIHSYILYNVINKYNKNDNHFNSNFDFYQFLKLWGVNNFLPEDYNPGEFNGKKTMSTFEKVLSILGTQIKNTKIISNLGQISDLELILKKGISKKLKWAGYYLGKLKLLSGDYKEAESYILNTVKKENNQFWSWNFLAEVLLKQGHNDLYFSALSKALSCGGDNDFLNNLREEYINELVKREFYNEANIELNLIIQNKHKNKIKLSKSLDILTQSNWYVTGNIPKRNNKIFYNNFIKEIEDYIYSDIGDKLIYIENINIDKKILNFKDKYGLKGFFSYKSFNNFNFKRGDIIKVKIEKGEGDYFNVYKIYETKHDILDFFPDQLIYVEYINTEKNIINFLGKNRIQGFFNYSDFDISGIQVGDTLNVKIDCRENEYYHLYKIDKENHIVSDLFDYEKIIIDYINTDKKIINFVGDYKHGFFHYTGYEDIISSKNTSDFLDVIFGSRNGDYHKIMDCRDAINIEDTRLKKHVTGIINIRSGNDFGFVGDIFAPGDLLYGVSNLDRVEGLAVKTYNRGKGITTWKFINLKKINL